MTNGQSGHHAPAPQSMAPMRAPQTAFAPNSRVCALLLIVVTFLAYQPVWHAGFIWDDDYYVTNNPALHTGDGLWAIWVRPGATVQYYPLVFTSFWLEYHFWHLQPLGYHLVNVFLHALNALLLWRVLRRLGIRGAWWAAAVFALHPLEVESVAWITERKNILSGFFYLLTVLAYLRFQPLTDPAARRCDWRYYPLVLGLFLCALLSKTVTCSLPAVLLLLIWWKYGRVQTKEVLPLVPLFVLGAAAGFMTTWMERYSVGASGAEWALSFVQRCLVADRALWFYAARLFWPHPLIFNYPRWEIDAGAGWQYAFPLAALAVLIGLWSLRSRIGRGPLTAVLFFAVTLAPALGFFNVFPFLYSFVADHFQYLAGIGLIVLTAGAGAAAYHRFGPPVRNLTSLAAVLVPALLAVVTWKQAHVYRDLETLWRDTLARNPDAWMAHNNLSDILMQQGKIDEAIRHLEEAVRLKPDAVGNYNLGVALARAGRYPEAIGYYEQALRLKPDYADANSDLGVALARTGRTQEAIEQWEQALVLKPDDAETRCNLGLALLQTGRAEAAVAQYQQALQLKPDLVGAQYNLGLALARLGRWPEAVDHYEQALRLKPDFAEAHGSLGDALAQTGKLPQAMEQWELALQNKPDYPEVMNNLAWLRATLAPADGGNPTQAVTLAQRACDLTGNRTAAYLDTLGVAYAAAGRFDDAVATARKAIELARADGQPQVANDIETRLDLYRAGRAYHPPANGAGSPGP